MTTEVLVYCHNRLFAEGLCKILESEPGIRIVGAFSGEADLSRIAEIGPDVILSDIDAFHLSAGFAGLPNKRILVVYNTSRINSIDKRLPELVSRGIVGLLQADADRKQLVKAVKTVASGELWLNHKTVKAIFSGEETRERALTRQEMKIGAYICKGYRNKEIARELDISEQTVKSHCNRIYKKLGVSDRLQLALLMIDEGLAPASSSA